MSPTGRSGRIALAESDCEVICSHLGDRAGVLGAIRKAQKVASPALAHGSRAGTIHARR